MLFTKHIISVWLLKGFLGKASGCFKYTEAQTALHYQITGMCLGLVRRPPTQGCLSSRCCSGTREMQEVQAGDERTPG